MNAGDVAKVVSYPRRIEELYIKRKPKIGDIVTIEEKCEAATTEGKKNVYYIEEDYPHFIWFEENLEKIPEAVTEEEWSELCSSST